MVESGVTAQPVVLLRADGGPSIGGGHIVRAGVLIGAFLKSQCDVHLIAKEDDWTRQALHGCAGKVHFIRRTDNESLIIRKMIDRLGARLVVLDVGDTSEEYIRYLKESGAPVCTIDDRGRGSADANATFTAGLPDRQEKNIYHGLAYAILSPDVQHLRRQPNPNGTPRQSTIFLGTFDPKHYRRWMPDALRIFPAISFSWFTSESIPPMENLRIYPPDRAAFLSSLASADLVIVSGGVTLYETAALGRPAIVLPQSPHEFDQAALLSEKGAVRMLQDPSAESLSSAIRALIDDPRVIESLSLKASSAVDGRGLERFLDVAMGLMKNI